MTLSKKDLLILKDKMENKKEVDKPMMYISGRQLNVVLEVKEYDEESIYNMTCIKDIKKVDNHLTTP